MNKIYLGTAAEYPGNSYYLLEGGVWGIMISNSDDMDFIEGLCEERAEAERLAHILFRNNVCPVHLAEVADDYMC